MEQANLTKYVGISRFHIIIVSYGKLEIKKVITKKLNEMHSYLYLKGI